MIDISNLSVQEMMELKQRIDENLNSSKSTTICAKTIESLVEEFNQKCGDSNVDLCMKVNVKNDCLVLKIDDIIGTIYRSKTESEETIKSLINRHLSYLRVYKTFEELEVDEYEFVKFDDRCVMLSFIYKNVNFVLIEDRVLDSLTLTGSIALSNRDKQKIIAIGGYKLQISSEDQNSNVKVELIDSQDVTIEMLDVVIESMADKILEQSLNLSCFR